MSDEEFEISEVTGNFDIKGFLYKVLSFWWLILGSISIGLFIAYYISVRKLPVYEIYSMVEIKDNSNPLFTSNTSLTFNWGGTSNKVNSTILVLQSRSHNEKVVKRLSYYIDYLEMGEYQLEDAYGRIPFTVVQDSAAYQLQNNLFKVTILDQNSFELSMLVEESFKGKFFNYNTEDAENQSIDPFQFKEKFKFNEAIETFFFKGKILKNEMKHWPKEQKEYYFSFSSLYATVNRYKEIETNLEQNSSILKLRLVGNNKSRMVDYLNGTIDVLSNSMLNEKNLFATKTIQFIDSMLIDRSGELQEVQKELNEFKTDRNIYDLDAESNMLRTRLTTLDQEEREIIRSIDYYKNLDTYLNDKTDYSEIPAPTVSGIEETSIATQVSRIIELSNKRNQLTFSVREDNPSIIQIDRDIEAIKSVLIENIKSTTSLLNRDLRNIRREVIKLEEEVRSLPQDQQDLLKIERRYDLSRATYDLFLTKKNEAKLIKAASVSDVSIIDSAKDTGAPKVGPNNQLNYLMAILFGTLIPLLFVFILLLLDNKINNPQDIEIKSTIPILGFIGKSDLISNLAVLKKPRSRVAESFRAIRTSLQFTFSNSKNGACKVIMCTSSIPREGKTFTSINTASVLSLSGKKTLLIGLDLRKPKIFDDFGINNNLGIVNYIIGQNDIDEITQFSGYENLDIITSGPIPPNPSELLINDKMDDLIKDLKTKYEYIIIDTPPIGLVSDAFNILKHVDTTLYIVRQSFTKKGMLAIINEKYKLGEVKNISFVLNFFNQKAKYGYSYDYGYGYGYGKYGDSYVTSGKKKSFLSRISDIFKKKQSNNN
jgi:capsular exopolysaccharide synthesis family protein